MDRYKYNDVSAMQRTAENPELLFKGDFYRTGVEIYVGSFPDVSGPDFVIDPNDIAGVELFKEFVSKLAEHYRNIKMETGK